MKKCILISLMLLLMITGLFAKEVVVYTGEYKPLVSESMKGNGFISEIIREVFQRMPGYELKLKFSSWKRNETLVDSGYAWGTFPYSRTEERMKKYMFSDIIFQSDMVFFAYNHDSTITYEQLSELKDFSIGGVRGYFYKTAFEEAGLNVSYNSDEVSAFKNLIAGRVDLVPMMDIIGWTIIKEQFPETQESFKTVQRPFAVTTSSMMISKVYSESEKILESFNKALASMKEDGTYQRFLDAIEKRYLTIHPKH